MVLGAAEVWADAWLDQEDNATLADALFQVGEGGGEGGREGTEGGRGRDKNDQNHSVFLLLFPFLLLLIIPQYTQWLLHKDELGNIPSSSSSPSSSTLLLHALFSNQSSAAAGAAAGHHDPFLSSSLPPSLQPRLRAPCLQDLAQQLRPCLQVGQQEGREGGREGGREEGREGGRDHPHSIIFFSQEDAEPTPQGQADLARLFFFPAAGRERGREGGGGGGGEVGEEDPPLFALTPNVLLPEVLMTYRVLEVEPEQPLRLIAPEFVCPQPPLR